MEHHDDWGMGAERREELRLLSLAVNETDRAVIVLNEDRHIVYLNRASSQMFGYSREEALGKSATELLKSTDPQTTKRIGEETRDRESFHGEMLFHAKDGREIWVSGSVNPVLDEIGKIKNLVVVLADITETRKIQRLQRLVLEAIIEGASLAEVANLLCLRVEEIAPEVVCSMVLVDAEGRLRPLANPSLPETYTRDLDGVKVGEKSGSCGTAVYLGEAVCTTDIERDPRWQGHNEIVLASGLRACWSSPIKMRDGRVAGTFAFYYRERRGPSPLHKELVLACVHLCMLAIEQNEVRQQLERLSRFDSLTGLPNRKSFYKIAEEVLRQEKVAFFALDIDRFKDVNTTLGHAAGERVLIEIAHRLQKLLQPPAVVARAAGDSFVAAVPRCDKSRASVLANKILKVLKEPVEVMGVVLTISVSVGIRLAEERNVSPHVMVEQASTAMHEAKISGRAGFSFFAPEMNAQMQERLLLGVALRSAITEGQLELYYQPQLRLKTMKLIGVEALIRWRDPVRGEIFPEQFIPLAEEIGEIETVGCWSLREACKQLALWRDQEVSVQSVSVNLSPLHFRSPSLPTFVKNLLKEFNIAPGQLTLEITEGLMMDLRSETLERMMELHEIGVGISMDDFGTGFSSLSRLTRLPITELKLDRSFMRNFESDPGAQAVAKAVIGIGQSLGMKVIAEGVETEAQASLLAKLGCDAVQGYLYSLPMSASDLERWTESAEHSVDISS
jgi:c-di-GMP-specific phosphodiesterase